jgi:chemotaxis protein MotB
MSAPATEDSEKPQIIVIKRIVKKHAHHGGAWKVAFADFATAMMAFFMLMWLMGSTTKEQKGAISEFFNNPSATAGASPVPSPSPVQGQGGASTSMIQAGGGLEMYKEPPKPADAAPTPPPPPKETVKIVKETVADRGDTERLKNLKDELQKAIDQRESLRDFKDQILLDLTPEGLRIQIVDKERRSMFASGSAALEDYSVSLIKQIAAIISSVPNRISITGHTDDKPYIKPNYGNWELSADRANAARRAMIAGGIAQNKIGRVVGLSSTTPLNPQDKMDPINRRISIVVLNHQTEQAIAEESGNLLSMQHAGDGAAGTGAPPAATADAGEH